jgi:uncharacterized membrane protein YdjX (TVP38/TMEM64 family)
MSPAIMIESLLEALRGAPIWVFLAGMSLLPLVGFPLSALWVLAGVTYGMGDGFLLILAGMAINFALAYQISNRWLRGPISRLFEKRGIRIPEAQPSEYIKLTIAIRIFPGLPNFMQSYLLGLANVPFRTYYFFSFPPQIAYAVGFVLFGDSLVNMKGGGLLLAVSILVAAGLLVSIVRKRKVSGGGLDRLTS